jgi:anti-repressor protein
VRIDRKNPVFYVALKRTDKPDPQQGLSGFTAGYALLGSGRPFLRGINMKELLKLDEHGNQTVGARELHSKLEIDTPFRLWFPRMCEYGFAEGKDYTPYKFVHPQNQQEITDYRLILSMAKEIAMIQRTDQGRAIRQYLISVEEAWNTPELIAARALKWADGQLKLKDARIAELEPKAEVLDKITATASDISVRELAAVLALPQLGQNNLFQKLRNDGYIDGYNRPYRKYIESGIMYEKEYYVPQLDATKTQLRITQKGVAYFARKYGIEVAV